MRPTAANLAASAPPAGRARLGSIATIARHEYLTNLRRPSFIFFTLLIPALGVLGFIITGFFAGQAGALISSQFANLSRPVGLVDGTGLFTPVPAEHAERFVAFADEAAARQALLDEQLRAYLVIPPDYLATGRLTSYATGGFFQGVTLADSDSVRAYFVERLLAGSAVPAEVAARIAHPLNVTPVTLDERGQPTHEDESPFASIAGFIIPYLLSIFLIVSIFSASSYLLRSVSEEKESRVIEVVLSSVSATELLAGKVLGLGALGLTQVLVWLLSAFVLTGGLAALAVGVVVALSPGAFALSVVYFVLGYLVYGTLMAAAGALGSNVRESQQLAGLFSFAAAIPLMFNSFILANPNSTLARALSYFPLTAPATMMLRLPLAAVPAADILISLAGLALAIPLLLWAGAKVFRMGLLLYGKPPGLRQIVRALREA